MTTNHQEIIDSLSSVRNYGDLQREEHRKQIASETTKQFIDRFVKEVDEWEKSGKPFISKRPDTMSFEAFQRIRVMQDDTIKQHKKGVRVHTSVEAVRDGQGKIKKYIRQNTYIKTKPKE